MLGLAIAVGMNSIKKLQGVYQIVFFLPYVTNTIALGLVFRSIFHVDTGLINELFDLSYAWVHVGNTFWRAFFVLMVYTVWDGLAFKIIVFLSGLQSIDKQYYQAAQIDSTPKGRVFSKITVPLLSPMILAGVNPILATILICVLSTLTTMYLVGGFNQKSTSASLGCILSLVVAGILSYLTVKLASLTGFSSEHSVFLYSAHPELSFVGIVISSFSFIYFIIIFWNIVHK